MYQGYPHYPFHDGSPFFHRGAEWGYPYSNWQAWNQPWDDWNDPYVGFDVSSIPGAAVEWGHKLGEQIGEFGSAAGEALKNVGRGISGAVPSLPSGSSFSPLAPMNSAAQKAGTAADATTLAAEEARRTIAHVSKRADATLDQIDKAAKEHEDTVRIVKYVMIGIAVLGGAALVYAVTK
jgi:hypothetical protein